MLGHDAVDPKQYHLLKLDIRSRLTVQKADLIDRDVLDNKMNNQNMKNKN